MERSWEAGETVVRREIVLGRPRWVVPQEPLRRQALGFDTPDQALGITVGPDGTWAWKDEHHLERLVELGAFSADQAVAIRAEGERVLEERPWPTGWEQWRPDPAWPIPELPVGWGRP